MSNKAQAFFEKKKEEAKGKVKEKEAEEKGGKEEKDTPRCLKVPGT